MMLRYLSITLGADVLVLEGERLDPHDMHPLLQLWLRARAQSADQERIDAIADDLNRQTADLQRAVTANTPHPVNSEGA